MTKRILLVDDESAVLFAYKKVLQHPGLEVDAADSKEATLQLLKKNAYDAVILDLRLGDGTCDQGFELIASIKREFPKTTIIMITAYGSNEIKEKALRLGAEYYFEKPVSTKFIQEALKNTGIPIPNDKISKIAWKFS
jgi:DNA-binding response OmpR family regulator